MPNYLLARVVLAASVFAMIAVMLCKFVLLPPEGKPSSMALFVIVSLPLAGFIPGLWLQWRRAYLGLCYIVLIYFFAAGSVVFLPHLQLYAIVEIIGSVIIFTAGLLASRWYPTEASS